MMKKLLIVSTIIAFIVVACCPSAHAQTSTNPSDPVSYMTPTQKLQYESDLKLAELEKIKDMEIAHLQKKVEQFGDWVGVGGEVGSAIEEGLTAVVDVADKFGTTDVGKFTMVLVAWKVVGKDVVRIVLGVLFLSMFTWLLIYSFRRTCIDRRVLIETKNPGWFKYPKEKKYELIEPLFGDGEGLGAIRIAHLGLFLVGIWITYAIMFAG
jgi:hypothetical protein